MSQIVPHLGDTVAAMHTKASRGRVSKDVIRTIQRERARGAVVAARLEAGAHATRVGLLNTAMLSKDEETLIQLAPLGEARYKAFVDTYAIWAVGELADL